MQIFLSDQPFIWNIQGDHKAPVNSWSTTQCLLQVAAGSPSFPRLMHNPSLKHATVETPG
jgi:hypothetical protein